MATKATQTAPPDSTTPTNTMEQCLLETLDDCIHKNGAMEPLSAMFDKSFFEVSLSNSKNEGITTSTAPPLPNPSI
jgi:hypothetical protein